MEWTCVVIVLQGGTASPFPSTSQTCCNVTRRPTVYYYQSVVYMTRHRVRMRSMAHQSDAHERTKQLEFIQRWAMKLIYAGNFDDLSRALDSMTSLAERRGRLAEPFFTSLLNLTSCLVFTWSNPGQAQQWRHLQASWRKTISRTLDSNWIFQRVNYMDLTTINNNCNYFKYFKTILYVCAFSI